MTKRLPNVTWALIPTGLADYPDFLRYMVLVENTALTAGPWFKLSVFGELGLNNGGRLVAREKSKSTRQTLSSISLPGHLTEYPRAGGGGLGSRASRSTKSSKSSKKSSSARK